MKLLERSIYQKFPTRVRVLTDRIKISIFMDRIGTIHPGEKNQINRSK